MPVSRLTRSCLVALVGACCSRPVRAAPILYQASSVEASYGQIIEYKVSGPGFSFQGTEPDSKIPAQLLTGYTLSGQGIVVGQTQPADPGFPPQLEGLVNVAGIDLPALFAGSAYTPIGSAMIPSAPADVPDVLTIPLTMTGTFTACLQVAGSSPSRPCDPNFLDYATVAVSLPGQLNFFLSKPYHIIGGIYGINLIGNTYSAPTIPEPSSSALLGLSLVLIVLGFAYQKCRYRLRLPRDQSRSDRDLIQ